MASIILMKPGARRSFSERRPAPLPICRNFSRLDRSPSLIARTVFWMLTSLSRVSFTARATSAKTPWYWPFHLLRQVVHRHALQHRVRFDQAAEAVDARFRLSLIALKSPRYTSVIFGGTSPV